LSKYDAPCVVCGAVLAGTSSSLPAGQRTCHSCRRDRRAAEAAAPRSPRRKKSIRCAACGTEFEAITSNAKYCGPSCRPQQGASGPPCIEPGCTKPSRKRMLCCTHYNRRYQPNRSHGAVPAREYFKDWVQRNPERAAVVAETKRRRRRARLSEAVSEPYTLAEIAARDKFTCQLCRRRVAMTKVAPHSKAPTIDHIRPLVESLDDTRANVQLAHFRCNSLKGTRGAPQQLALFG
jgi:5-methylcytosine-specific restriction endonuclease McrA